MKCLIKVMAFCNCFILFSATPNVSPFPNEDLRLPAFKQMCEELAPIVKDHSGRKHTCFITYAWPSRTEDGPLNSWIIAIQSFLSLAGIEVYFDREDFGGLTTDLEEKCKNALKNIVLLTPDLKIKHDEVKTQLVQEIGIIFKKPVDARKLILLSSTAVACLPDKKYLGGYVSDTELIHMMTPSDFRNQKETDEPCIDRFFSVMCSLLDPKNSWGLLSNIQRDFEETCHERIQRFLTDSNLSFSKEFQQTNTEKIVFFNGKSINNLDRFNIKEFVYQPRCQKDGKNYLDEIKEALQLGEANICGVNLKGTGGVGKSTLAYEYAKKNEKDYDFIWVFPCETVEEFEASLKALYKKLNLPGVVETMTLDDIKNAVYADINLPGKSTLLIYDNVLDEEFPKSHIIKRPKMSKHVLVTSRKALRGKQIKVDVFTEQESIDCLKRMITHCRDDYEFRQQDEQTFKKLADLLNHLPLAVVQAAAYIGTENISLEEFITRFEQKNNTILEFDDHQQSIPRSFYTLFRLSFDALKKEEKNLLFKLCYLSPDDISTAFFDNDSNVLTRLKDYSLIDIKNNSISLHRLLQLVGREQSQRDKEKIIGELLITFETVLEDNLPKDPKEGFTFLENIKKQLSSLKKYTQFENFENLLKQINDQQFDYILECLDKDNINEKESDLLIRQYLNLSEEDFNNRKNRLQGILDCFTRASDRFEVISLGIDIRDEDLDELKFYFFKMKEENSDKGLLHGFFSLCLTKKSEWKTKYEYFKSQGVWFDNIYDQIAFNENIIGDEYKLYGTKKGVEWLKRSAKKGSKFAQYNLGVLYEKAKGVKQDFKKAVKWYKKAEKQGHISSKFNLGICYECGRGVEKNDESAFSLYKEAAESGHTRAQYNLSLCYEKGIGTSINIDESLKWLKESADYGNPKAQYNLAVRYEREKEYENALRLFELAAQKEKDAAYKTGMYYHDGTGATKDYKKAFDFFSLGMKLGSEISQVSLGILYANGHGVKQNYKNATSLWESLPHNKEALYQLGKAYYYGNGVTQSIEKGFKLIKKSADLREYIAHSFLEEIYEVNRQCLYRLALILLDKTDSNTYDPFEGTVLLIKAVKNGDKDAQKKLLELIPNFKFKFF